MDKLETTNETNKLRKFWSQYPDSIPGSNPWAHFFFHLYVTQFLHMYNGNYKGTHLIRRHIEGAQLMLAMIFILKKT